MPWPLDPRNEASQVAHIAKVVRYRPNAHVFPGHMPLVDRMWHTRTAFTLFKGRSSRSRPYTDAQSDQLTDGHPRSTARLIDPRTRSLVTALAARGHGRSSVISEAMTVGAPAQLDRYVGVARTDLRRYGGEA